MAITEKVVGERRVLVLRDLGARASEAKSAEEACAIAATTLALYPEGVPFALFYLISDDRKHARLAGVAGVEASRPESPVEIDLEEENSSAQAWPVAAAVRSEARQVLEDL